MNLYEKLQQIARRYRVANIVDQRPYFRRLDRCTNPLINEVIYQAATYRLSDHTGLYPSSSLQRAAGKRNYTMMRYLLLIVWIGFIGYALLLSPDQPGPITGIIWLGLIPVIGLLLYIWQTRLPVNEEQTTK